MSLIYKVSFEIVSPVSHPEHYCTGHGSHPATHPRDVPDEHWHPVEREGDLSAIREQYRGLLELQAIQPAQFVRNVKFWTASAPVWQETDPNDSEVVE